MTNENNHHKNKRKKLYDFKNWFQWFNLTQTMLEEKCKENLKRRSQDDNYNLTKMLGSDKTCNLS